MVVGQLAVTSVEDISKERHIVISDIIPRCEISGFLRGVVDVFDLLRCSRRRLVVRYRRYGITISRPVFTSLTLKDGTDILSRNVRNQPPT